MKNIIIKKLKEQVTKELKELKNASQSSMELVKSGDLKSDGKYDTRGTEAGYLAGAQAKRVHELELELELIDKIPTKNLDSTDEISIGALIELESNKITRTYFLSTTGAGTMIKINDAVILVISAFSPIGSSCIGLKLNDEFELEVKDSSRIYKIKNIS